VEWRTAVVPDRDLKLSFVLTVQGWGSYPDYLQKSAVFQVRAKVDATARHTLAIATLLSSAADTVGVYVSCLLLLPQGMFAVAR
jgi:hypothetical protein